MQQLWILVGLHLAQIGNSKSLNAKKCLQYLLFKLIRGELICVLKGRKEEEEEEEVWAGAKTLGPMFHHEWMREDVYYHIIIDHVAQRQKHKSVNQKVKV